MIYLASASSRRRKLLETLSISFEVEPVDVDERPPEGVPVEHVPLLLSKNKAARCAEQRSEGVILAADTVVVDEGKMIGKPADQEEAEQILRRLRDHAHQVITGVTVQRAGSSAVESITCVSQVVLRDVDDQELASYVSSGKPFDRAGAYGIQDREFDPVRTVKGCRANVLGLPICLVPDLLQSVDERVSSSKTVGCQPDQDQDCQVNPCEFSS